MRGAEEGGARTLLPLKLNRGLLICGLCISDKKGCVIRSAQKNFVGGRVTGAQRYARDVMFASRVLETVKKGANARGVLMSLRACAILLSSACAFLQF